MKQDAVLQILKQKNTELERNFGVRSLLLFGSVARDEATTASDVDLVQSPRWLFWFVRLAGLS